MKDLYESILGDIDDTIARSDKASELIDLGLPEFDDYKKALSKKGGNGPVALYIWKLPSKVLSKISGLRDKLFEPYIWLSPLERNADNLLVGVSPKKIYIKLAIDHTIVGFPLINLTKEESDKSLFPRTFEDCKEKAYNILLKIAEKGNLEYLLRNCGSKENYDDIINKILKN